MVNDANFNVSDFGVEKYFEKSVYFSKTVPDMIKMHSTDFVGNQILNEKVLCDNLPSSEVWF